MSRGSWLPGAGLPRPVSPVLGVQHAGHEHPGASELSSLLKTSPPHFSSINLKLLFLLSLSSKTSEINLNIFESVRVKLMLTSHLFMRDK